MAVPQVVYRVTEGQKTFFRFGIPQGRGVVSGLDQLTQHILLILLTTPGSDRYERVGGGLTRVLHDFQNNKDLGRAIAGITEAVNRTQEYLISSQAIVPSLMATERLRSVQVENVLPQGRVLEFDLIITNEADESTRVSL